MTNIRKFRENANLTIDQLAQFLRISPEEAGLLENGQKPITTVQLDRLCDLFICSENELLGLSEGRMQETDFGHLSDEGLDAVACIGRICRNIQLLDRLLSESEKAETY